MFGVGKISAFWAEGGSWIWWLFMFCMICGTLHVTVLRKAILEKARGNGGACFLMRGEGMEILFVGFLFLQRYLFHSLSRFH